MLGDYLVAEHGRQGMERPWNSGRFEAVQAMPASRGLSTCWITRDRSPLSCHCSSPFSSC
ncbi:MAG: hypothetical protein MZV65_53135 [Chromatiales bacterium]|nr:hypothetical protein [Chromatiales bacterium]